MTNHYHLVVETRTPLLSKGMHRLNGIYAQQFNARQERAGHVFESRFSAHLVDREHYLENACQYVLGILCAQGYAHGRKTGPGAVR